MIRQQRFQVVKPTRSLSRLVGILTCLLLTAFCLLPSIHGQSATATLSGTVTDENNAVVPGVEITILNLGTATRRQVTTNDDGHFIVPLLSPGSYSLTARREGFFVVQIPTIVLNVGDDKILDLHLKVGDVKETVTVTAEAPLISESPAVGIVVDRQFVSNIPLNGRSFQSLIALTPGVVITKTSSGNIGQFSVNGQRASANYFTVDGVSANIGLSSSIALSQSGAGSLPGVAITGGTNNLVSVDALQEFKIQTSTYAPEFGRSPGAQVSIITRSGTDQFHATLFEYFRNDVLDARDWFTNSLGLRKPPLRQNDFGGVVGGPVLSHRTFFFFSYEGLRLRQPQTRTTDVPSLASRQSAIAQIQPFLNSFPLPNGAVGTTGFAKFSASFSDPSTLNAISVRIDHNATDKLTFFGRINFAPSNSSQRALGTVGLNTLTVSTIDTATVTGGATWTPSPTYANDLRVNFSRLNLSSYSGLDNFGGGIPITDTAVFPSAYSSANSLFTFQILGGSNLRYQLGRNADNLQRQINVVNGFSILKKRHQIKLGVDYRHLSPTPGAPVYSVFPNYNTMAAAITAKISSGTISATDTLGITFENVSTYVQDTWRATPRLSLTYGMRWEVNPPPRGRDGSIYTVAPLDNPAALALAPEGTPLYGTKWDTFAPRVGVSYQLFRKAGRETVLRGGVGKFYDLGTGTIASSVVNYPYRRQKVVATNTLFPFDSTVAAPLPFNTSTVGVTGLVATVADPNLTLPYAWQWNAAVEQSLGQNQTVSASYVAAIGRQLLRPESYISPNSTFSQVIVVRNSATSNYQSMQLQFQRRLSKGLQTLAAYVWSHSIDNSSDEITQASPNERFDPQVDKGPSDFDIRHSFTSAVIYNIPSTHIRPVVDHILGNWSFDTIATARSATPVNVIARNTIVISGQTIVGSFRPDLIIGQPLYLDDPLVAGGRRINRSAFSTPTVARQGTLGRNALRGFGAWQINFGVHRKFSLSERLSMQFRAEIFNLLNHPNFADPINTLTNTSFGVSTQTLAQSLGSGGTSGGLSPLYQIGGPRSIQFGLRIQY